MSTTESSEYLSLADFIAKYTDFVSFCKDSCKYYLDKIEFLDLRLSFDTLYSSVEKTYDFSIDLRVKIQLSQIARNIYIDIEYYSPLYDCVIKIRNLLDSIYLYIKDYPEDNNFRYCDKSLKHSKLFQLTIEERKTDSEYESVGHKYIKYEAKYNEYFKIIYNLMTKIISLKSFVGSRTKGVIKASSTN
jgi:hypothetical protein